MASLFWASTSKFDEDVDKATAETLPSGGENLELNFEISDCIRSKTVPAKEAMRSIKRRLNHKNPNVQLFALSLADTCVKNGGDHFLTEIASREFMDNLVSMLKAPGMNPDVKQKILRLVQNWALAFESKTGLGYTTEVYKVLQKEGFSFPPKDAAAASAAMVDTMTPPEWIDSDVCLRCRTPFSFTNRKHHCRSCGLVFDQQCSSKVMALPHLGIMQPVRVCDSCLIKAGRTKTAPTPEDSGSHSHLSRKLSRRGTDRTRHKSARELADEELQRAIQLSLEEAGLSEQHGPRRSGVGYAASPAPVVSEPPIVEIQATGSADDDPELRAAIEASLREANAPKPSAPVAEEPVTYNNTYVSSSTQFESLPNFDLNPVESDAILTFSQTVEAAHAHGAADLVRHQGVNELYDRANSVRPKLARSLDDTGRKEQLLAEMNEKLSQAAKLYDHLLTAQVSSPTRYYATPAVAQPYQVQTLQHASSSVPQYSYPQTSQQYPASWETGALSQESPALGPALQTSYYSNHDYSNPTEHEHHRSPALREVPPPPLSHPVTQTAAVETQLDQRHTLLENTIRYDSPVNDETLGFATFVQPVSDQSPRPVESSSTYAAGTASSAGESLVSPRVSSPPVVSPQQPMPYSFPIFPSAPTAPLPSLVYRAPVEQKEAMLISFD